MIEPVATAPGSTFTTPAYVLHLDDSGITVLSDDASA